jgi:hypothetical protein
MDESGQSIRLSMCQKLGIAENCVAKSRDIDAMKLSPARIGEFRAQTPFSRKTPITSLCSPKKSLLNLLIDAYGCFNRRLSGSRT